MSNIYGAKCVIAKLLALLNSVRRRTWFASFIPNGNAPFTLIDYCADVFHGHGLSSHAPADGALQLKLALKTCQESYSMIIL